MEGLSAKSVVVSFISQLIVFLYLLDNDTSWMILGSSGIGCCIEFWKIGKAMHIEVLIPIIYNDLLYCLCGCLGLHAAGKDWCSCYGFTNVNSFSHEKESGLFVLHLLHLLLQHLYSIFLHNIYISVRILASIFSCSHALVAHNGQNSFSHLLVF